MYFLILYYIAKIQQAFTPLTAHGSKDPGANVVPSVTEYGIILDTVIFSLPLIRSIPSFQH